MNIIEWKLFAFESAINGHRIATVLNDYLLKSTMPLMAVGASRVIDQLFVMYNRQCQSYRDSMTFEL